MTEKSVHNLSEIFTDTQLADIVLLRAQGLEWEELKDRFNKKYQGTKTLDSLKHAYRKYGNFFESDSDSVKVAHLKEIQRTKKTNSKTARENKSLLDFLNKKDDILEELKEIVSTIKTPVIKQKVPKFEFSKDKKDMTLELMISDTHYGKVTQAFNNEVARKRMRECAHVLLAEAERAKPLYNVHRIILAFLGDIIESETMHALESARGCEAGNPKQVMWAIESLFFDLLLPVSQYAAKNNITIDCPMVPGNHDRSEQDRTYHNPGEYYWTWVIYNTLQMLAKQTGVKNCNFYIATGCYILLPVYKNNALYEHFDNTQACTKKALEALLNDRQTQLQKIIHFMRGGHYHEYHMFGRGKIIVNESLPGPDSYSETNGYDSQAGQTLNYYIDSDRPTCFFRSFPIYLE